jgi:aminoglycoside phosphotransferase (APT) family kinase protein
LSSDHPPLQQLTALVRLAFPDVEGLSCEPVPGEHANVLYHLSLDNGLAVTLKVYATQEAAAGAAREAHLLQMLTSETGVPVPRLLYSAQGEPGAASSVHHGSPWALMTRLPGESLSRVMDRMDSWEREAVGYETGRYLARVHAIGLDRFGALLAPGAYDHEREKAFFCAQTSDWLERCDQQDLLPGAATAALRRAFAETTHLSRRQPCLVHGQFRARDVIVDRGVSGYHVTGFVDLARARAAAPELDIGMLFACDFYRAPEIQKGFLDGYAETGDLGPAFWERLALYQAFSSLEELLLAQGRGQIERARTLRSRLDRFVEDGAAPRAP